MRRESVRKPERAEAEGGAVVVFESPAGSSAVIGPGFGPGRGVEAAVGSAARHERRRRGVMTVGARVGGRGLPDGPCENSRHRRAIERLHESIRQKRHLVTRGLYR